jgi:hypothetical protein
MVPLTRRGIQIPFQLREAKLIKLADKISNVRSVAASPRSIGDAAASRLHRILRGGRQPVAGDTSPSRNGIRRGKRDGIAQRGGLTGVVSSRFVQLTAVDCTVRA